MPGKRSRQGCEECRRRRRKCDEVKPTCGQCSEFSRSCDYTLRLVWGGRKFKKSRFGECLQPAEQFAGTIDSGHDGFVYGITSSHRLNPLPQQLPNGISLPRKYHKLLIYFSEDVLASLSCHPSVHADFYKGLIPMTLESPHLLSACLALSAAGFLSRGIQEVEGTLIPTILEHLQSSGLALLRTALASGPVDDSLLATCLIWCLVEIFACRQGESSWRVHLSGINAILDEKQRAFSADSQSIQPAMKHLYQLYMSLRTLPYIPSFTPPNTPKIQQILETPALKVPPPRNLKIDGFLGYSEELLHVLQQIDEVSTSRVKDSREGLSEADVLLGKVNAMILRDSEALPEISICVPLSSEYSREFRLCHRTFQHSTLIHIYRRLYHSASNAKQIREAVTAIETSVSEMSQGLPCHTWVAMAMPLFTIGCEAFTGSQRSFVLDKMAKLEECIGSLHVKAIKKALQDIWDLREGLGDTEGNLCAKNLLETLQYSIIMF